MEQSFLHTKKILLVDDEPELRKLVIDILSDDGFTNIIDSGTVQTGLIFSRQEKPDLAILDVMLPDGDGFSLMKKLRAFTNIPVIFLTAKDEAADKLAGLGLGADDYITKPFSVTEVLARIKANIRRSTQYVSGSAKQQTILQKGGLSMNLNDYSVTQNGNKIELTAKEFEILKLLLQNQGKVYTKEQIYSLVWNDAYFGDENAVNVHISRLRNKIEKNPREPQYIITVWGIGYKFGEIKDE